MTPRRPRPRTEKTERQRDQRRVRADRLAAEELRRRIEQADPVPERQEDGVYRP